MRRPALTLTAPLAAALLVAGCTAGGSDGGGSGSGGSGGGGGDESSAATASLEERAVLVPGTEPAVLAARTAQTLFSQAPVVVVASTSDLAAQGRAASVAVRLGAPLLLSPAPETATTASPDSGSPDGASPDSDSPDGGSTTAQGAAGDSSPSPSGSASPTRSASPSGSPSGSASASPSGSGEEPTAAALEELGAQTVLAVGPAAVDYAGGLEDVEVVTAPDDAGELSTLVGVELAEQEAVPPASAVDAVATLPRTGDSGELLVVDGGAPATDASPVAATTESTESPEGDEPTSGDTSPSAPTSPEESASPEQEGEAPAPDPSDDRLQFDAAEPLDGVTVLATRTADDPEAAPAAALAATATARAAGAEVVVVDIADPRAAEAVPALSGDAAPQHVVALGDSFGPRDQLAGKVEVAATGVELPAGGQLVAPGKMYIALYGHPGSSALGVLGEQGIEASIRRAQQVAASYEEAGSERPVVPTFEMITTVASSAAGSDGDYSDEIDPEAFVPWVEAARDAGVYVVLDLQPGRTDFLTQAQRYESLLRYPNVGLALDPEWRLRPEERHLQQIGSVDTREVNEVAAWLADLTAENALPQKMLLLHQFRTFMLRDRHLLDTSHDELAIVIQMDGHGAPGTKFETWGILRQDSPEGVFWGWKNFYDEDSPTFTPARTLDIEPTPVFVSYQ